MLLGAEQLVLPLRIATVVAPIGLYFLVLGLLNSRRTPQLVTGRLDFALLLGALSPLVVLPLTAAFGLSLGAALLLAAAAVLAGTLLSGPATWVIYNIDAEDARGTVAESLRSLDIAFTPKAGGFDLPGGAYVQVTPFALLRNVSIRVKGGDSALQARLFDELCSRLGRVASPTTPMAVSLLLVATAMLVLPLTLVANRVPEIVRIVTDLIH